MAPFRAGVGRAGVRFKLQDTHTPLPHRTRRQSPFLAARILSLSGCRPPELGPRPPPFRAAPGPSSAEPQSRGGSVRPAVPSHSTSRRYAPAARARRQFPGRVAGTRGDRPIPARRAYLPVPADGLAAGALQPSFFPLPSGRVPPTPARGLGTAPVAPGRLARPLSSCLARRGASGVRRRRG